MSRAGARARREFTSLRGLAFSYGAISSIMIANTLAGVIVARSLSVGDRGLVVLAVQLSGTAGSVAMLGAPVGVVLGLSPGKLGWPIWPLSWRLSVATLVCAVGATSTLCWVSGEKFSLGGSPLTWYIATGLLAITGCIGATYIALLRAQGRIAAVNVAIMANPVAYLGSAALLASMNVGAQAFLGASLLGSLVALVASIALYLSGRGRDVSQTCDQHVARGTVSRLALGSYLGTVVSHEALTPDILLLGRFGSPDQVALYAAALAVASLVRFQAVAASNVLFPRMAKNARPEFGTLLRVAMLATVSALVMFPLGLWAIPRLYGHEYHLSPLVLGLVLGASVASVAKALLVDTCRSLGMTQRATLAELSVTAVVVVGALVARPQELWIYGALTLAANLVAVIMLLMFVSRTSALQSEHAQGNVRAKAMNLA
ncbi:MAG: hypothetical protein HY876_01330 [Coriobacteriales bacterium]|nr:hypothetical protein [Coriobacteriales bacterium]